MESTFEFDPEVLDNLYKHQLQQLKEFTLKLDRIQDINLCRKWLQILNKTSEDEKVSRNCLCVLMCQQLKNDGRLSMPFTDLSNCNRDLNQVLAALDKSQSGNSVISSSSSSRELSPYIPVERYASQENEIVRLRQELMDIRVEISQKEAKIQELNKIIDNCNQCSMENDVIQQITQILENFKSEKIIENLFIFTKLFAENNNLDLEQKLMQLDKKLHNVLQEIQTAQVQIAQKQFDNVIKSKAKHLKNQELRLQKLQHKLKTKVAKLKFCWLLSQNFLKSRQRGQTQFIEMLDTLEKRYKDIILKFSQGLPYDLPSW
ncbi:uncharacterized protein LOC129941957 [Eupeodes corollae]|uniref:uncharacterized protein LOC129941957 n=1 Tax=Eupeodes corollae TaxID=290404 RepID=UPI00249076AA|nr:uncharacterized protein LOC129941957 [Eupeodes corollae]